MGCVCTVGIAMGLSTANRDKQMRLRLDWPSLWDISPLLSWRLWTGNALKDPGCRARGYWRTSRRSVSRPSGR
jgi:hypothetical protein